MKLETLNDNQVHVRVDLSERLEARVSNDKHAQYAVSGIAFIMARLIDKGRIPIPNIESSASLSGKGLEYVLGKLTSRDFLTPEEFRMAEETKILFSEGSYTNLQDLGITGGESEYTIKLAVKEPAAYSLDIVPTVPGTK